MIENPCVAWSLVEPLNCGAHSLRRKHLHWHAVVLVKDTRILNPKRKLWSTFFSDDFTVKDRAGDTRAVASWTYKITHVICILAGQKTVRRYLVDGRLNENMAFLHTASNSNSSSAKAHCRESGGSGLCHTRWQPARQTQPKQATAQLHLQEAGACGCGLALVASRERDFARCSRNTSGHSASASRAF